MFISIFILLPRQRHTLLLCHNRNWQSSAMSRWTD